jgi:hypothetical protein
MYDNSDVPDRAVSLCRKRAGNVFMDADLMCSIALRGFLAIDAKRSMRHDAQSIQTDYFIASETDAVGPFLNAGQRCLHKTNVCEIPFQNPRGEVPFFSESHFVHHVRRFLDRDRISTVQTPRKCIALAF